MPLSKTVWGVAWFVVLAVAMVVDITYPIATVGLALGVLLQLCASNWVEGR